MWLLHDATLVMFSIVNSLPHVLNVSELYIDRLAVNCWDHAESIAVNVLPFPSIGMMCSKHGGPHAVAFERPNSPQMTSTGAAFD